MSKDKDINVVIIGAGPAGLTAALMLSRSLIESIVLEQDNSVGGIAKTLDFKGFKFDVGGHRFFSKSEEVNKIWHEILGSDLLNCKRLSRIYYNKKFFYYPLRFSNIINALGLTKSIHVIISYISAKIFPIHPEDNFEQWISNRFGRYLYKSFFKTYSEKVWGIPCNELSAQWAAQRIKNLNIMSAIWNIIINKGKTKDGAIIDTLIDNFLYPKKGSGMMWDRMSQIINAGLGTVKTNVTVEKIFWSQSKIDSIEVLENGEMKIISGSHFISTMPITELIKRLAPAVPSSILEAANKLHYRDFIIVALIINKSEIFKDNWIYIHDKDVLMSRIQNFKNWSPDMTPDNSKTCLGIEYFCTLGDNLWNKSEQELINLAKKELVTIGLISTEDIEDGTVYRQKKAYPVYDYDYLKYLETINDYLKGFKNLYLAGRNGLYQYNNMDHSMITAMTAVKRLKIKD
jgi:protoporphyrinogen oxidase